MQKEPPSDKQIEIPLRGKGKHIGLSNQFDSSMYCVGPLPLSVMAHSRINKALWSQLGQIWFLMLFSNVWWLSVDKAHVDFVACVIYIFLLSKQ